MTTSRDSRSGRETRPPVRVRYWAAARAAAGTSFEDVELGAGGTLADLLAVLRVRHPGERFARVLGVCSVLVDDRPVASADPADVAAPPGARVELLPPFAGG
jgi:molybdopterin synthase sulfur carrier subunit